ncbi:MAG: extracellular solute-binding protein [Rhodocyclaceae bacterium]|nr:extracellular solute-binding protein [Rhodocyclaceae bacterium]
MTEVRRWCGALAIALFSAGGVSAAREPHGVILSHSFDPARAAQLGEIVARFNAGNPLDQIDLQRAGDSDPKAPTLLIVAAGEVADLRRSRRVRPLHQVMAQAGLPLKRVRGEGIDAADTLDSRGRRLGLPIGLHTPLLFVNRNAFRAAGLDPDSPPRTWKSLQDTLTTLVEAGHACPYTVARPSWVMLDNVSARHHLAVTRTAGRAERLSVNGMLQVRHVALMASWVRARYLHLFGRGDEAEARFARGECTVLAASSASWPGLRQSAGFELGVSQLPYYDDMPEPPGATLVDGASLWMVAGKSRKDYRTAARFVRFLLEPDNQLHWQRATGFLPLSPAGVFTSASVDTTQPNLRVASDQLRLGARMRRVVPSSLPSSLTVRNIIEDELDGVWAGVQPAKQALDNAVTRAAAAR